MRGGGDVGFEFVLERASRDGERHQHSDSAVVGDVQVAEHAELIQRLVDLRVFYLTYGDAQGGVINHAVLGYGSGKCSCEL